MSRRMVTGVGCGTVLGALLLSGLAVGRLGHLERVTPVPGRVAVDAAARRVTVTVGEWMSGGTSASGAALRLPWSLTLDPLSGVMLLVVTGVGFLIHVYSAG